MQETLNNTETTDYSNNDEETRNNDNLNRGEEEQEMIEAEENKSGATSFWSSLRCHAKSEIKELMIISWPLIISNISNAVLGSTDVAFVGHLGEKALAASSLGNSFFMTLGFILIGLLSAQDTLVSQASGAGNERMKRIVLLRSLFIEFATSIPILVIYMFCGPILLLLGQDKEIVELTSTFVRLLSLGLWPMIVINTMSRYLVAQSRVLVPMCCGILSCLLNVAFNALLIQGVGFKGLGFIGAPIATSLTRLCIAIMLTLYVLYLERKKSVSAITTDDVSREANSRVSLRVILSESLIVARNVFHRSGIIEYFKLAIPGMLQLCLECWAFTATGIFVGWFGHPKYLAAHTVISSITYVTYMVPFSLAIACSVRVGICLGSKMPQNAKVSSFITFLFGVSFMSLNGIGIILLRKYLVRIFTTDADVLDLASKVIIINALFQVFDAAQTCLAGVLRGTGKQVVGAVLNFISFYVLGLPLGLILAFPAKMKLYGIWTGVAVAMFIVTIIALVYVLVAIDFEKQVQLALDRVARSDVEKQEETIDEGADDNVEMAQTQKMDDTSE